ncbi:unnamed protein product [Bursaphelenchus xylophilus]|uniref:(pine wood nematode) hypothetical protein n=1 Tax=Bursaphelenchus xylophilus TaxID=6326 RepID=A0A811LWY0_BURXY|nr:unnamed protein product [Bursaphelenchus xylophilus]CAG9122758.1 unnamed protein product [Bursaphelenchus xylophilus]
MSSKIFSTDSFDASAKGAGQKYRLYKIRWALIAALFIMNLFYGMLSNAFDRIQNVANSSETSFQNINFWFKIIFPIGFLTAALPSSLIISRLSILPSMYISLFLGLIGIGIRFGGLYFPRFYDYRFSIILFGHTVTSLSHSICLILPSTLSHLWFPSGQRTMATSVPFLGFILGKILSVLISGYVASVNDTTELINLTCAHGIFALLPAFPLFLVWKSRPRVPPTSSADRFQFEYQIPLPESSKTSTLNNYVIIGLTTGCVLFLFDIHVHILESIETPTKLKYVNSLTLFVISIIGTLAFSGIVDSSYAHKTVFRACLSLSTLSASFLSLMSLMTYKQALAIGSLCLMAFCLVSLISVGHEMMIEMSFGNGTTSPSAFIWTICNVVQLGMMCLYEFFKGVYDDDHSVQVVLWTATAIFVLTFFLAIIALKFVPRRKFYEDNANSTRIRDILNGGILSSDEVRTVFRPFESSYNLSSGIWIVVEFVCSVSKLYQIRFVADASPSTLKTVYSSSTENRAAFDDMASNFQLLSRNPVLEIRQQFRLNEDPVVQLLSDGMAAEEGDDANPDVAVQNRPIDIGVNRMLRMRRLINRERVRIKREIVTDLRNETIIGDKSRPKRTTCSEQALGHIPNNSTDADDVFPDDLFTFDQRRHGAIIFHFCGLCYMFVALAIVCDEYFVPSLGVLTQQLGISDDVAGATFMAAGGSAPEFFTSLFGVFITQNNVGVGTIVGSATFNILCVLAFCCLFSRQILHLKWWPMFRDMSFYVMALFALLIFFRDEQVDWIEAFFLFSIYICYGVFMKYNEFFEQMSGRLFSGRTAVTPQAQLVKIEQDISNGRTANEATSTENGPKVERNIPVLHSGAMFRTGLMHMALEDMEIASDTSSLPGGVSTFSIPHDSPPKPRLVKTKSQPSITPLKLKAARLAPARSLAASVIELDRVSMASSAWSNSTAVVDSAVISNGNGMKKDRGSIAMTKQKSIETEIEQPVDISWPNTTNKRVMYIILIPIMIPLYFTLADVKKPGRERFMIWTFSGSILWIALYSYLMVWWANTIGSTIGIPNEIMGLTILAAGTSIPDLITSIIVARKGLGDMAVSSSIGSNLFDVCVGLPIPWLMKFSSDFVFKSRTESIAVVSNGLICSVGMLFSMLLILYLSVWAFGWRMNKKFGFTMITSYVLMCIFSVLLELDIVLCPLRRLTHHC